MYYNMNMKFSKKILEQSACLVVGYLLHNVCGIWDIFASVLTIKCLVVGYILHVVSISDIYPCRVDG
jgi:hypothetical protein